MSNNTTDDCQAYYGPVFVSFGDLHKSTLILRAKYKLSYEEFVFLQAYISSIKRPRYQSEVHQIGKLSLTEWKHLTSISKGNLSVVIRNLSAKFVLHIYPAPGRKVWVSFHVNYLQDVHDLILDNYGAPVAKKRSRTRKSEDSSYPTDNTSDESASYPMDNTSPEDASDAPNVEQVAVDNVDNFLTSYPMDNTLEPGVIQQITPELSNGEHLRKKSYPMDNSFSYIEDSLIEFPNSLPSSGFPNSAISVDNSKEPESTLRLMGLPPSDQDVLDDFLAKLAKRDVSQAKIDSFLSQIETTGLDAKALNKAYVRFTVEYEDRIRASEKLAAERELAIESAKLETPVHADEMPLQRRLEKFLEPKFKDEAASFIQTTTLLGNDDILPFFIAYLEAKEAPRLTDLELREIWMEWRNSNRDDIYAQQLISMNENSNANQLT